MRRIFWFLILVISLLPLRIFSAVKLTDHATIYLVTCDPGPDMYAAFGHSAIWVVDSVRRIDFVYNYGVFDFNTPNFYMKFIRGRLKYKINRESFRQFIRTYFYEQRSVYRQKLLLSPDEKQKLFDALETNCQPENRYYLYDYLQDNCATRVIDQIERAVDSPERFVHLDEPVGITFRQDLDKYLKPSPWMDFGIDLALGLPADQMMTARGSMFLPDDVMKRINSKTEKNTEPAELIFEGEPVPNTAGWLTPFNVILVVSIIILVLTLLKKKSRFTNILDKIVFGISGVLGLVLLFLWLGTDHSSMKNNLNVFWAMPINLIIFFKLRLGKKNFFRWYFLFFSLLMVVLLVSWTVFPQSFHFAIIPFLVLMMIRAFYQYIPRTL